MITQISTWLEKEPRDKERYMLPLYATFGTVLYTLLLSLTLFLVGLGDTVESPAAGWEILTPLFVVEAFFVALIEETVFRIIPLVLIVKLSGMRAPTLVVLLGTSVIFGLAHGGPFFLPLQGVAGFIFGLMLLKFSKSGKALVFASSLAIGMHFVYDITLGLIVALAGGSSF